MTKLLDGQVTIACQNNAVPSESQGQYIAMGLWVTDFGNGHSFQSENAVNPKSKATETFNRIAEASRNGGIGTLRANDSDLIAVGRFGHNGIRLLNRVGKKEKNLKGLQFSQYAVIGPGDEEYKKASELADTKGGAVAGIEKEKIEQVENLLNRLYSKGRLRQPVQ